MLKTSETTSVLDKSRACAICGTEWRKGFLKSNNCPKNACYNPNNLSPQTNAGELRMCETHGLMEYTRIKIRNNTNCVATHCEKHLKRSCEKCGNYFFAHGQYYMHRARCNQSTPMNNQHNISGQEVISTQDKFVWISKVIYPTNGLTNRYCAITMECNVVISEKQTVLQIQQNEEIFSETSIEEVIQKENQSCIVAVVRDCPFEGEVLLSLYDVKKAKVISNTVLYSFHKTTTFGL